MHVVTLLLKKILNIQNVLEIKCSHIRATLNIPVVFCRTQQMATTTCERPPMMRDALLPDPCTTQTIAPPDSQGAPRPLWAVAQELPELRQVQEHRAAWLRGHERAATTLALPPDSRTTATPNSTRSPVPDSPSSLRPVLAHRLATSLNAASWTLPLSSDTKITATRTIRPFVWVLVHLASPR